jgi:hypothetical protein
MKADRAPMLRRHNAHDKVGQDMNLPPGKTCADCVHVHRCCALFGHMPQDQVCDWYPSRFHAIKPAAQDPP